MSTTPDAEALPFELDFPLLDPVPLRILGLFENDEFEMRLFAEVASIDPGVANQLLKLASSPLYGASQKFDDVKRAVVYLGLRTALTITLGISLFKCMRRGEGTREERWCWRRLLLNAAACRELASVTDAAPMDLAFVAGLVQDFGLLLLLQQQRKLYYPMIARFGREPVPLWRIERAFVGCSHATVSARLLEHWRFLPEVVRHVSRHHDPNVSFDGPPSLLHLMIVAEATSDFLLGPSLETYHQLEARFRGLFSATVDDIREYLELIASSVRNLADILQVEVPADMRAGDLISEVLGREPGPSRG